MVGDLTQSHWRERVVWNFYEATSISFGTTAMIFLRRRNGYFQTFTPGAASSGNAAPSRIQV